MLSRLADGSRPQSNCWIPAPPPHPMSCISSLAKSTLLPPRRRLISWTSRPCKRRKPPKFCSGERFTPCPRHDKVYEVYCDTLLKFQETANFRSKNNLFHIYIYFLASTLPSVCLRSVTCSLFNYLLFLH